MSKYLSIIYVNPQAMRDEFVMNKFAERLKYLRKTRGVTQTELAKHLGCRNNTISSYETAEHQPEYNVLMQIAEYFHVSVDFLLGADLSADKLECIPEEIRLIQLYRMLDFEEKEAVFRLINLLVQKKSPFRK